MLCAWFDTLRHSWVMVAQPACFDPSRPWVAMTAAAYAAAEQPHPEYHVWGVTPPKPRLGDGCSTALPFAYWDACICFLHLCS
jgi:hypothetical protein